MFFHIIFIYQTFDIMRGANNEIIVTHRILLYNPKNQIFRHIMQ